MFEKTSMTGTFGVVDCKFTRGVGTIATDGPLQEFTTESSIPTEAYIQLLPCNNK